jgi:hypothetical protein
MRPGAWLRAGLPRRHGDRDSPDAVLDPARLVHAHRESTRTEQLAKGTAEQQKAWGAITKLCELHRQKPPDGWLDWLNGMRNLNVHRARQVHILLQCLRDSGQPQMIVFAADPVDVAKRSARFDLHLRCRPQLPDMQDFIASPATGDLWINERATTTLPGIVIMVDELIEEAAHLLLAWWEYASKWSATFPPPPMAWLLDQPPWPSFDGVSPSATPFPVDVGLVGPHMEKRLRLAERLRQARNI